MKIEHRKQFKQRLDPIQFENISKEDNFMYRMGMKSGYRLAIEHLNRGREIVIEQNKTVYTINTYKKDEINKIANPIIDRASKITDIPKSIILSDSRFRKYVIVRSVIINVLRSVTDLSTPQIGDCLNRDHTSVLHHLRSKSYKQYCWKEDKVKTYNLFNQLISEFKATELSV